MEDMQNLHRLNEPKNIAFIMKWGLSFGGGGEKWIEDVVTSLISTGNNITLYIPIIYKTKEIKKINNVTYIYYNSKIISIFNKHNLMNFVWPFLKINISHKYDYIYIPSFYAIRLVRNLLKSRANEIILGTHDFYLANRRISRDITRFIPIIFEKILEHSKVKIHCISQKSYLEFLKYKLPAVLAYNLPYSYGRDINISNKLRITFINRINYRKGGKILIELINQLNDFNNIIIKIAGFNDIGNDFLIAVKNSNNCEYLSYISDEKKIELLENSDVFLLLSDREAAPISQLEAMASGLFVISTWKFSSTDFPAIFINEKYLQITNRNSKDVIKAIILLFDIWQNDKTKFLSMKNDIRNNYLRNNDPELLRLHVLNLFKE